VLAVSIAADTAARPMLLASDLSASV
jgi:hypothetical protein